jgi:hypothetical protein
MPYEVVRFSAALHRIALTMKGSIVKLFFVFRIAAICILLSVSSAATANAGAGQDSRYQFVLVKENPPSNEQYVSFRAGVSINNQGTAAIGAAITGGYLSVFTYGQPTAQTFEGRCTTGCFMTSINDAGTVAFAGAQTITSNGIILYDEPIIFTVDARTVTRVAQGRDLDNSVSINDYGNVAFSRSSGANGGIYATQGGSVTRISDHTAPFAYPVINNHGTVAFFAYSKEGTSIVTGNGGPLTPIARDKSDAFPAFVLEPTGTLAFNDKGTVAFITYLKGGKIGIVKADGGTFSTIVENTGAFDRFSTVALNNKGQVAFQAYLREPSPDSPVTGIFTGPDPVADKVLAVGDPLFNSTVTQLALWRDGLNDAGQIAFLATLADGRQVIGRTTLTRPAASAVKEEQAQEGAYLRMPF